MSSRSVSYTHLDVYKRQIRNSKDNRTVSSLCLYYPRLSVELQVYCSEHWLGAWRCCVSKVGSETSSNNHGRLISVHQRKSCRRKSINAERGDDLGLDGWLIWCKIWEEWSWWSEMAKWIWEGNGQWRHRRQWRRLVLEAKSSHWAAVHQQQKKLSLIHI